MITDLILNTIYYLTYGVLNILPTGHLPTNITNSIGTVVSYTNWVQQYFPVNTLIAVAKAIIAVELLFLGLHLAMFALHRIPTQ